MSPEERQLLEGLFERIKSAAPASADKEAEEFIGKSMKEMPHAGYVLSQAVIVQDEALKAAMAKIEDLEGQVEELQEKADKASANTGFLGGIGKSLFGGNDQPEPRRDERSFRSGSSGVPSTRRPESGISVPPPPDGRSGAPWSQQGAAPGAVGQQAGQQQSGSGSFLKGAMGAAAGVAGGMLLANAVGGLFSGKSNPLGIGSANAAEKKDDASSTSGDDWGDDKADSGDNWKDDDTAKDTGGDDWDDDDGDDEGGDDWGDDDEGGDSWDD